KLLAEPLEHYPHVLRFKALQEFEGKCSMSLICNGRLYCFEVGYSSDLILIADINHFKGDLLGSIACSELAPDQTEQCIKSIRQKKIRSKVEQTTVDNIEFALDEIGVKKDLIFIRLSIKNSSNIIYSTQNLLFLMQDKKTKKASNSQEYPIYPVKVAGDFKSIEPGDRATVVVVFKAFTIPEHKTVRIILKEESDSFTGRDMNLDIKNKAITKAKELNTHS
ncbi:DUF4138 domain-containing protein, partial [Carboxylicivirga linearis]